MKKILVFIAIASIAFVVPSCKGKMKDSDIKSAVDTALGSNPSFSGLTVTINDGVATISGEVQDEATKTAVQTAVAGVKGVKSVQNNTMVTPPQPSNQVVPEPQGDALAKAVNDAIKDYPGVTATIKNQVVVLGGQIARGDLQKLMMTLNGLKSMGLKAVDSKGLMKK